MRSFSSNLQAGIRRTILCVSASLREVFARHRLAEIEPGLFLADDGETLDLRGPVPTWRNFRLVRVSDGPSPWQWAILGAAALVALTWLGGALARTVRRSPASRTATSRWRGVAAAVAAATALVSCRAAADRPDARSPPVQGAVCR